MAKSNEMKIKTATAASWHAAVAPCGEKRKVAIVGYAPSSRDLAPYNDKTFKIWGVNELYKIVPRVDVLFELHDRKWFRSKARNPRHLEWLKTTEIPVFTLQKFNDIPASIKYPIEDVKKFLAPYNGYFTNSISYMIALAIMLQFDEIHIYGVDMATDEEYQFQRPSVEFYLGIAAGIYKTSGKCFVYIPPECDLLKTMFQYGYESDNMTAAVKKIDARIKEIQTQLNNQSATAQNATARMHVLQGALDDVRYFKRCLFNTKYDRRLVNVENDRKT